MRVRLSQWKRGEVGLSTHLVEVFPTNVANVLQDNTVAKVTIEWRDGRVAEYMKVSE